LPIWWQIVRNIVAGFPAGEHSGFSHLGRFSNACKQAFGESSSDTLDRTATVNATLLEV